MTGGDYLCTVYMVAVVICWKTQSTDIWQRCTTDDKYSHFR